MKAAMARLAGVTVDGKTVNELVRKRLTPLKLFSERRPSNQGDGKQNSLSSILLALPLARRGPFFSCSSPNRFPAARSLRDPFTQMT